MDTKTRARFDYAASTPVDEPRTDKLHVAILSQNYGNANYFYIILVHKQRLPSKEPANQSPQCCIADSVKKLFSLLAERKATTSP